MPAAGSYHTVLLLDDGQARAGGWSNKGQCTLPDTGLRKVVQFAKGPLGCRVSGKRWTGMVLIRIPCPNLDFQAPVLLEHLESESPSFKCQNFLIIFHMLWALGQIKSVFIMMWMLEEVME